jgi:hypothetical protein
MVGSASGIRRRYQELSPVLDERGRRRFGATEARAYGYGGVSGVSRTTVMARSTIGRGVEEISEEAGGNRADTPAWGRTQNQTLGGFHPIA